MLYRPLNKKEIIMIEYFLPLELKEGTPFICPVCGSFLAGVDKPDFCQHVLFIHDRDSTDFIYCNEFCIEMVQESLESADKFSDDILQILMGRLKATTTIFFEVSFLDPAKDPSTQVQIIGIDLSM
jgi:hypothetical protein